MRLHDPARPKTDNCPLYVGDGNIASARYGLPVLYVDEGGSEGSWSVTIHMPTSGNVFETFSARLSTTDELCGLFRAYEADPEEVIARVFKYEWSAQRLAARRNEARAERNTASTLAALGLDDED